jgi:hypothetical protein
MWNPATEPRPWLCDGCHGCLALWICRIFTSCRCIYIRFTFFHGICKIVFAVFTLHRDTCNKICKTLSVVQHFWMCQIKENLQTFPLATDKLGHLNTSTTYRSQKSQILVIIGTVQIGRSKLSFHSIPFFFTMIFLHLLYCLIWH